MELQKQKPKELIEFTSEGRIKLSQEIGRCLLLQRTYGKITAEDLPAIINSLIDDLKEYEPQKIIQAVVECRKKDDDFITLASILRVLNPQIKIDFTFYNSLKKRQDKGETLKYMEIKYMEAYETEMMKSI